MSNDAPDASREDENFRFLDEGVRTTSKGTPWKIVIADDDRDIHLTTRMVLKDFEFQGRGLEFLHAYDGDTACELIKANPDTAILLLDVVMERPDAGLTAVRRIRDELGNRMLRIILRTGQPGHAPEREVVLKYHINDYKSKLELTVDKLYTSLVSALRSFEDLQAIESHRVGLVKVLDAASNMDFRSQNLFVSGLLTQLGTLLGVSREDLLLLIRRRHEDGRDVVMAAVSGRNPVMGAKIEDLLDAEALHYLARVFSSGVPHVGEKHSMFLVPLPDLMDVAVYIGGTRRIDESELELMTVFCRKIVLAYQNFEFVEHARLDQYAEIALLATVTGRAPFLTIPYIASHGRLSRDIAQHMIEQGSLRTSYSRFPELIERAAMFADIGNDSLPSGVLEKPAELTPSEREIVRTHPERGHRLLQELHSTLAVGRVIGLAREIALTHHERFDGTGYPSGLRGRNIPVAGRIVAVANSYTAMTSNRPWRVGFTHEQALAMMQAESKAAFDPEVIDALVAVVDGFRQRKAG
ncbi:HD domain-containing phosphohydrolase [Sulfuritalea hydrogenivorans]|uniref:Putative response regulator n=1 Tax=Sulfuritalea hydrogenivorans sk43H TaxID=1223802 RepID=W0SEY7_9PROT|nr:HD domain-containing phosphohydrolase [Sulfuritalea hydrogenivorans]BAO29527.1 putative response regulator [Sulfuritalea hydrogenivorans sk43H]